MDAGLGLSPSCFAPFPQRYGRWRSVGRSEQGGEDSRRRDHEQRRHHGKVHLVVIIYRVHAYGGKGDEESCQNRSNPCIYKVCNEIDRTLA